MSKITKKSMKSKTPANGGILRYFTKIEQLIPVDDEQTPLIRQEVQEEVVAATQEEILGIPEETQEQAQDLSTEERPFLDFVLEALPLTQGQTYGDVFLSLFKCSEDMRDDILRFLQVPTPCGSVDVAMDAFLSEQNSESWASHDVKLDSDWNLFVSQMRSLGLDDQQICRLSKPSGPQQAALTCLWHYPTFRTAKSEFGMTLDRTNPCLSVQWLKMRDCSKVRTQDTYPMRADYSVEGPQWDKLFDQAEDILPICHDFAKDAILSAPLSIVLGKHNAHLVEKLLQNEVQLSVERVYLTLPFSMYGEQPFFLVVRNEESWAIRHLIFFSYHAMRFKKGQGPNVEMSVFHDLLWNAVCRWAGVPIAAEKLFSDRDDLEWMNQLSKAQVLRRQELNTGSLIPISRAREIFKQALEQADNAEFVDILDNLPPDESAMAAYIRFVGRRGNETQRTEEWKQTPAAQKWRDAHERGQQTRKTAEWKQSPAGQAQEKARLKGVETTVRKSRDNWEEFMNLDEVQELLASDDTKIAPNNRWKKVKITALAAKGTPVERSQYVARYCARKDGRLVPQPGLQVFASGKAKKDFLATL